MNVLPPVPPTLYRVVSASFTAGVVIDARSALVVTAAPILGWAIGKHFGEVARFCRARGWSVEWVASRTIVVNVRDCPPGWEDDPRYVYVGRRGVSNPGDYGNRHRIGLCFACDRDHDRHGAVAVHAEETRERFSCDPVYRDLVERLRGKYLVCYCKRLDVDVPCHADVYVELVERR